MSMTPSQKKHLAALTEHANHYGAGPTRDELGEAVYGGRKGTAPSVTRAVNALEGMGYVQVLWNAERNAETFSPTDAGRDALAAAGAAGGADTEEDA